MQLQTTVTQLMQVGQALAAAVGSPALNCSCPEQGLILLLSFPQATSSALFCPSASCCPVWRRAAAHLKAASGADHYSVLPQQMLTFRYCPRIKCQVILVQNYHLNFQRFHLQLYLWPTGCLQSQHF